MSSMTMALRPAPEIQPKHNTVVGRRTLFHDGNKAQVTTNVAFSSASMHTLGTTEDFGH